MSELEDFRSTILAEQTRAEQAMVYGDAEPRMKLWSRRDPVTLFGAWGMSRSGWDELSRIFRWVARQFSNTSDFRFDVEVVEVGGNVAFTVGYERFRASINGGPVKPMTVRVTHGYRREEGEWKIVHRHGDSTPAEQYASGKAPWE
jgi:ketosteroid isomerase-like protein